MEEEDTQNCMEEEDTQRSVVDPVPFASFSRIMHQLQQNAVEQPKKNVLMIAYLFPPAGGIGAAGSQRVLKFAKYLPRHHWRPVVLTVRERDYESYLSLDLTLLEKVPPNTTIVKTMVIRWMTKLLEWQKRLKSNVSREKPEAKDSGVLRSRADGIGEQGRLQSLKDAITDLF